MEPRIQNEICPITQESILHKVCTCCCQNTFEAIDLISWIYNEHTCPMCRCTIFTNDLILKRTIPSSPTQFLYNSMKTRQDAFKTTILDNYLQGRTLVYAGRDIHLARNYLTELGVSYTQFTGRIINKTIYNFNAGSPSILLVDLSKFTCGINVTCAKTLIVFDEVSDPEILKQVIGRCQRIGRTGSLEVHHYKEITQTLP